MGGLYSHTPRPPQFRLTNAAYNADHQNHIDNLVAAMMDDYSASLSQMRSQVDPGEISAESQAGSLAGELERLRYGLAEAKGTTYWYETPKWSGAMNGIWCVTSPTWGAKGDGVNDDTAAIAACIAACSTAGGGIVIFPPGTYLINGALNDVGDGRKYGILYKSKVHLVGYGRRVSILKLKSGSTGAGSTDAQMFFANSALYDIGVHDLGFDGNASGNTLTTQANVSAFWFEHTSLEVYGMTVGNCRFSNWPGGTVLIVSNRSTSFSGYPIEDVRVIFNEFEDNCFDDSVTDHSSLNLWGRRSIVAFNRFRQSSAVPATQRYLLSTICELHGKDSEFSYNRIDGAATGVIFSENFIEPATGMRASGNVAKDLGHAFARTSVGAGSESIAIDDIRVDHNHIELNNSTASGYKFGLMFSHRKPLEFAEFSNNVVRATSPHASVSTYGVSAELTAAGTSYVGVMRVKDNTFRSLTMGAWFDNGYLIDTVKHLVFTGNTSVDMTDLGGSAQAAGLWVEGPTGSHVLSVHIDNNQFLNLGDIASFKYGAVIRLYIDNIYVGTGNRFQNMKTANVNEVSLTFTTKGPVLEFNATWDPPSVSAGSYTYTGFTVPGAALGDQVDVGFSLDLAYCGMRGYVQSANTVYVVLQNPTVSPVDLGSGTVNIKVTKKSY